VNKLNPAWDVYIDVLRDCNALKRFVPKQQIQRSVWDLKIAADIKQRFIWQEYVQLTPNVVYLTLDGLKILGYREATG
jgi:hypothetical protein